MGRRPAQQAAVMKKGTEQYALKEIATSLMPLSEESLKGKSDLFYLSTEILGYKDVNSELHREYCKFASFVTNPRKKKLDLMPREHFKTTIGTIALAIQEILNDPDTTILLANFTWGNARKMLDEIKFHFQRNEKFIEIYGNLVGPKWNEDEIIVSNRKKPNKTPTIETAGTEKTLTSAHYKLIILDDLVSRENINTMAQIEGVIMYYKDCLDLLDKKCGRLIIHGTRWAFYELYGWILKHHHKDFDLYIRRAVENGRIIFPERFTKEALSELKRQKGLQDFSCQYFNYVLDLKNALVKSTECNYYIQDDLDKYCKTYPLNITMVVDGAIEERANACETAITVVGTTIWDDWVLLEESVGHWGPTEAIEQMIASIVRWRPQKFGIQKTTFEKLYKISLEKELSDRKIYSPEIHELSKNPNVTKHMQIMSLRPRIERKGLFWKQEHERFELSARQYPQTVAKDVLDSLSRHTELAEVPYYNNKHDAHERGFGDLVVNANRLPWNM